MPLDEAMETTMGIMSATVPVLLTKAPMTAVTTIIRRNSKRSLPLANVRMRPPTALARPVCTMAPPTTKRPTIMTSTGLEKPDNASVGVSTPVSSKPVRAQRATMSARGLPTTNKTIVDRRIMITNVI